MSQATTVNVIGLGYVGVACSLHIASRGTIVHGWDLNEKRVHDLRQGNLPFAEEDLLEAHANLPRHSFHIYERSEELPKPDLWLICVGSPLDQSSGGLSTKAIRSALKHVLELCEKLGDQTPLILLRSTVPPRAYENEILPFLNEFSSRVPDIHPEYLYFPEFLREGSSLQDSREPGFVIIGHPQFPSLCSRMPLVRRVFQLGDCAIENTSIGEAEMVKFTSNAFHALKVAFANEIGSLCSSMHIDGAEVMRIFTKDKKLNISAQYLRPGFAFGGPCLEKDLVELGQCATRNGLDLKILNSISDSNQEHLERTVDLIEFHARGKTDVAIFGTSFKTGSSDRRNSPMIALLKRLAQRLGRSRIHIVNEIGLHPPPIVQVHNSISELLSGAAVAVLGPHPDLIDHVEELKNFKGPIVDLKFSKKLSAALAGQPNYYRLV